MTLLIAALVVLLIVEGRPGTAEPAVIPVKELRLNVVAIEDGQLAFLLFPGWRR